MPVRLRLALVTVLVAAGVAGFFLWPRGNHAAGCSDGAVAPLPAGAQKALDSYGSSIRYDIETLGDGERHDSWLDPVTGATRILSFDSEGRLTAEQGLSWTGNVLHSVTVSFTARGWTAATASASSAYRSGEGSAADESAGVRRDLAAGTAKMLGRAVIGGRETLHIRWLTVDLWVDPLTYVPVRTMVGRAGHGSVSGTITWLPGTASNLLSTTIVVPQGFRQLTGPSTTPRLETTTPTACGQS
jgi:hypothetical protein